MGHFKFIGLLTILCIINKSTALKRWCCSSDEPDSPFCGKFLDESNLTYSQKLVNLVECPYPYSYMSQRRDLITKCMVQKTTNFGKIIYLRSCVWEERNAEKNTCLSHSPPYGHRILTCETCLQDKCNNRLTSDSHDDSSHIVALFEILFICLTIILII